MNNFTIENVTGAQVATCNKCGYAFFLSKPSKWIETSKRELKRRQRRPSLKCPKCFNN